MEDINRITREHAAMKSLLEEIDDINAKRAEFLLKDCHYRVPYEMSLGHCLDRIRRMVDELRKP
jgi:hypothetical protein